jgi:hypothetical protein
MYINKKKATLKKGKRSPITNQYNYTARIKLKAITKAMQDEQAT